MGKDKTKPAATTPTPAPAVPGGRPPKGHRQRGAGTVITAKPAVVTGDGIVLKAHERLPSQLLHEYCQKEKRPLPKYYPNPPGNKFRVVLHDEKNKKNDLTFATPQSFDTASVARDFGALLALFHMQRQFPLERRLPEPYASTWVQMIATEKEQAKGGGKATAAATTTAKPSSDSPTPAETKPKTSINTTPTTNTNQTSAKASKTTAVVVLHKDNADWLCDSCGNQNFAKLASGAVRLKCFKCQSVRTESCQLVASTANTTTLTSTTSSNSGSSTCSSTVAPNSKIVAVKTRAPVDLLKGKTITPITRAEEERAMQEKRATQRRKQLFFDALRRANRPHIVHIPAGLRAKLERILGMATAGKYNETEETEQLCLEDVLLTYTESGLFAPDSCDIPAVEQIALLQRVSARLCQAGFAVNFVASTLHEVLLRSASDLLDDALEELETTATASASSSTVEAAQVAALFEKLLHQACIKYLCINVEESQLPDAYNPRHFESQRKLSVVAPTTAAGGGGSSSSAAVVELPVPEAVAQPAIGEVAVEGLDAVQLLVLKELQSICTATTTPTSTTTTAAADNVLYTSQHCITALKTATSLLQHCSKEHVSERLSLLSLLLLQEAAQSSNTATPSTVIDKMNEFLNNTTESGGVQTPLLPTDYTVFLEECESLVAIFEDTCIHTSSVDALLPYHTIQLQVSLEHMQDINTRGRAKTSGVFGTLSALTLQIIAHPFSAYPSEIPLIYLHPNSNTQLTTTVCSTIHTLQTALRDKAQEFVGEILIFQLHSYLQECLDQLNTLPCVTDMGAVSRNLYRFDAYFNGTAEIIVDSVIGTDEPVSSKNTNTTTSSCNIVMNIDDSDTTTIATTAATDTTTTTSSNTNKSKKNNRSASTLTSFWSPLPTTTTTTPTPTAATTESRRQLPAYSKRTEVITLLQTHRAIVVTGETGCGKTTQVPQYLYEHNAQQRILICQPRRLAAVGVATRVAEEVGCALGQQVGYMVKGDSQVSVHTRIAFCTYGVLLRRLQCDPTLSTVSTVVLDEVHERGLDSDFTLALLMFAMARRSTLKVILMSATISTAHFAQYLQKWLKVSEVPVMFIPGFTFPVQEVFKNDYEEIVREFKDFIPAVRSGEFETDEAYPDPSNYYIGGRPQKGLIDYDLLTKLIMALAYGYTQHNSVLYKAHGSILVFMPGVPEINKIARLLDQHYNKNATSTTGERVPCLTILPLHGNLSPTEQKLVYKKVKPNELKVVIATNVAEASVTLPDITVVVDTCRVKEVCMDDELQTSALVMRLAAKDSLRQRKGRAGRVQKGRCFRLITQGTFDKLPEHSVPEILRVSLEKVVLQVKAMMGNDNNLVTTAVDTQRSTGVSGSSGSSNSSSMALLCRCPDVPSESSVLAAEQLLQQIQALDSTNGLLTPLGRHLSALPCMPRVGKLCIYGALLGCVYTATAVAACMTLRTPFLTSQDSEVVRRVQLAKERYGGDGQLRSDFTVLVNLMQAFQETKNRRRFCLEHGVSHERMAELGETQEDLLRGLVELRLLGSVQEGRRVATGSTGNRNCHLTRMVTATLTSGLYPHLAKILRPTKRYVEVSGGTVQRDHLAKEIKFYIPKTELALNQSTDMKTKTIEKVPDIRNVDISTDELQRVFIHPSSCNFQNFTFSESNFVMYGERQLVKPFGSLGTLGDSKLYLRDTIEVPVFALLFFGGGLQVDYSSGVVTVDGWIRFTATGRVVAIIQELRAAFDSLLQRKFDEPDTEIAGAPVIELACQLLNTQAQY